MKRKENISETRINSGVKNNELDLFQHSSFSGLFYPYVLDSADSSFVGLTIDILNKKEPKDPKEEKNIYSQISVKFLTDYVPPVEVPEEYSTKTCAEMGYAICGTNTECSGDTVYAKDNVCCVGSC